MAERNERAAQRYARRMIFGVVAEAGSADAHCFVVRAGAAVFLGELGEDERRRVTLDPASKLFDA